jgi:hypothetical protein
VKPDNIVSLVNLADGSAVERVNLALQDLWDNCQDPNTSPKAKRSITLQITVHPNSEREEAQVSICVTKKLAPLTPVATRLYLGQDRDGCHAVEARRPPVLDGLGEPPQNVTKLDAPKEA